MNVNVNVNVNVNGMNVIIPFVRLTTEVTITDKRQVYLLNVFLMSFKMSSKCLLNVITDKRQAYLFARSQLWLVAPTAAVETTSENLTFF